MEHRFPVRKSHRKRQRTKYSIDPLEGLDILSDDSGVLDAGQRYDESEDEEFALDEAIQGARSPEPDDLSMEEGSDGEAGLRRRRDDDGEEEDEEDSVKGSIADGSPDIVDSTKRRDRDGQLPADHEGRAADPNRFKVRGTNENIFTRGVPETSKFATKVDIYKYMLGTGTEDLVHFILARDKWSNEPTLPKKKVDKHGHGGLGYSFSHTAQKRQMEANRGWDWYYDHGGKERFAKQQKTELLTKEEGVRYMPNPAKLDSSFVVGPAKRQRLLKIKQGATLSIGEAWKPGTSSDADQGPKTRIQKGRREGWMLNVGDSVKCLGWVPNQRGDTQYLALTTLAPTVVQTTEDATTQQGPAKAPAYAPSAPSPTSIQIWAICASSVPGREGWMDLSQPPELRHVICTDWGPLKQFSWCPMPRNFRLRPEDDKIELGLLGGVWGDGKARVLDIQCPGTWGGPTLYCRYTQSCFESVPPETVCTSIHWLSSFDIGCGCANGFVSLWNISENVPAPPARVEGTTSLIRRYSYPRPWFYQLLHPTYILALTTAYPSHPNLLITSSMDGYLRLTDLRAPDVDYMYSARSRVGSDSIAWSDTMQSVLVNEENNFVRAFPLRRFFTSTAVARLPSSGSCLASGIAHPMLLIGCSDGAVIAVNPIRRLLNHKIKQYQQIWFQHDWTRKGGGCSRITEGYKVESASLGTALDEEVKGREAIVLATIYEEAAGITHVAWNPNLECGGWAAAGMGSGLIRIEDLAQ